jgi:hypothetical protein
VWLVKPPGGYFRANLGCAYAENRRVENPIDDGWPDSLPAGLLQPAFLITRDGLVEQPHFVNNPRHRQ